MGSTYKTMPLTQIPIAIFTLLALPALAWGQEIPRHEIGLLLGILPKDNRLASTTRLEFGPGTALQANYGFRLAGGSIAALYAEVHLLASPQRGVTSSNLTLTRDVATLFLTPGLRVKFFPKYFIAPYAVVGGGWSVYEHSTTTLGGAANPAPRTSTGSVFNIGGGVDVKVWKFIAGRAEVRSYDSPTPVFNSPFTTDNKRQLVASGGVVLRF